MKINGSQIITGMYVYNENQEFTKDDFVIYDGVIYTCVKDVKGEDPKTSDSFVVYLGDKGRSITFSEYEESLKGLDENKIYLEDKRKAFKKYLEFLETSEGENKYITVGMLQSIMSCYLLGPTGKGIIGDYIYYDSEGMRVSLKTEDRGIFTDPETILSEIMFHPDINHALLRVSRFLPEINGYVGSCGASEYAGEDQKSVILRQYTYIQEDTEERIRLQELIDPVDGLIWYRSGNMDTKSISSSGTWKCSVINSRALKSKVESLIGIYTSRLKVLKSLETHLKSNFRYKKLDIQGKPVSISIDDKSISEITLTISERTNEGFIKNSQTTLNLEDRLEGGEIPLYLIGKDYIINISQSDENYTIELSGKDVKSSLDNVWISEIFYKEYYGLS